MNVLIKMGFISSFVNPLFTNNVLNRYERALLFFSLYRTLLYTGFPSIFFFASSATFTWKNSHCPPLCSKRLLLVLKLTLWCSEIPPKNKTKKNANLCGSGSCCYYHIKEQMKANFTIENYRNYPNISCSRVYLYLIYVVT